MRTNSFLFYSFLAALMPYTASAGIRVGNLSRNNAAAYQQLNELRYGAQTATTANPIPVANTVQAVDVTTSNTPMNMEKCSMIYPDGEFALARPTLGRGMGGATTCTAVVEMRAIGAGPNGSDAILARANLAAGDAVECNISMFPNATYLPAAGEIEFPADAEPTIDDVIKIMNAEQKQNAGLKIAAGAIIGGLGGNMAGRPEPGSDGILGGGKAKTNSTIIGALGGAALMAGNAYTGKVAGDTILSTGVNAAAGAVVGNIVATGDSVLRIEGCTVDNKETKCLWGYVEEHGNLDGTPYISAKNPSDFKVCKTNDKEECEYKELNITNATIAGCDMDKQKNRSTGEKMDIETLFAQPDGLSCANKKFCYRDGKMVAGWSGCDDTWVQLDEKTVNVVNSRTPAMVVDIEDNAMGWKKSDWSKFKTQYASREVVGRTGRGVASNLGNGTKKRFLGDVDMNFSPVYQEAEDGAMIDLSNKARMKGTLTGAGVGAGMGAFAGYQGAQKDVEDRWVSAVREYKDSLQKIYCVTGNRFLSYYNDTIIIPDIGE
ncbi:MAG: hypothetical protein E7007_03580 [Alphaproteobacteria bacterium]|nr:hypothetical protein [Alphaproteobacteria bacterium]